MTRAEALLHKDVPEEQIFYVTFGQRYRHQQHPAGMKADGYAIIVAKDEMAARQKANEVFGQEYWAFMYDHLDRQSPERFHEENYSLGVLAVYYA